MSIKGTRLHSILTGSCPRCHGESMYKSRSVFQIKKIIQMNEKCSKCGLKYMIEPSFFYGAMYVSYALNVGLGILVFIILHSIKTNIQTIFIAIIIVLTILFPWILRLSRNLYINLFVKYDKGFKL
jgi:uncharacterized protein (DUF983 family)